MTHFALRLDIINFSLHIYWSSDAKAVTISLSGSYINMVIIRRVYARQKSYCVNWLRLRQLSRIGLHGWLTTWYAWFWLWLHRTKPNKTMSWSRSPLQQLQYSGDNVKTLHQLSKCSRWRCRRVIIHSRLNDWRNPQFRCAKLHISFTEVVGCILPARFSQFVRLHLLLSKPLHVLLYRFGDCANHPAGFVLFAQLALLSLYIRLILLFLPIVGPCKISQTVSDRNQHLLNSLLRLSGLEGRDFSMHHIVLLLLNRCLHFNNWLSWPSVFSLNIVLNPFHFDFIAWEVCFMSVLRRKFLFGSQAAQSPKGSDSLCLQATLALIHLMISLGSKLCQFAKSAHRKWRKVYFRSIDHCNLSWFRCWARCWMLQVMGNRKASCIYYLEVGTITHLAQTKLSILPVNTSETVTLTVQHHMIVNVMFMQYPADYLRESSALVLSLEQIRINS